MDNAVDRINLETMRSADVVDQYSSTDGLLAHERVALDAVAAEMRDQPILDIGVGAGRTVMPLVGVSRDYLGVDYSPEMVAACRARYPEVRFEHADARRLDLIADNSIALAVFSCNGISMVGHEDRIAIMREVHRVLKPGGAFLFTTYNLNSPEATQGFQFPSFKFSMNPARTAVRLARFAADTAASVRARRRNLKHEIRTSEYAVINDFWHNYGVMLYYITLASQRRQLDDAGFAPNAMAFDNNGVAITGDSNLNSIALIARK